MGQHVAQREVLAALRIARAEPGSVQLSNRVDPLQGSCDALTEGMPSAMRLAGVSSYTRHSASLCSLAFATHNEGPFRRTSEQLERPTTMTFLSSTASESKTFR